MAERPRRARLGGPFTSHPVTWCSHVSGSIQPIKTPRHQKADAIEGTYCQLAISYGDRARRCGMGKVRISGRSLMNEHFTYA
jgi:hypothetical protein